MIIPFLPLLPTFLHYKDENTTLSSITFHKFFLYEQTLRGLFGKTSDNHICPAIKAIRIMLLQALLNKQAENMVN